MRAAAIVCAAAVASMAAEPAGGWNFKGGTLSVDAQGWAYHPAVAVGPDGALYAAWTQHLSPPKADRAGTYVKRWADGKWQALGGRICHTRKDGANVPEAYSPALAVLGQTLYLAWYEGGGYGWGGGEGTAVFVAHWDGAAWVYDKDTANASGALNVPTKNARGDVVKNHGRNPALAVVAGKVYAAWIETRNAGFDLVMVKHLDGGQWVQDGDGLTSKTKESPNSRGLDVALADVKGVPHVAWSELKETGRRQSAAAMLQVARLENGKWTPLGGALNRADDTFASYLALAVLGDTLYVAFQERTRAGNNQVFVKHWDGTAWAADGGVLNADAKAETGRPGLAAAGANLWLAWTESLPGQRSQIYTRRLAAGKWSDPEGSLNADPKDGAADAPAIAALKDVPQLIWAEKDFATCTKQVYVRGRGDQGAPNTTALARYGANGPAVTLVPNQWVKLNAGGIADAKSRDVGDEGYGSLTYSAAIKKALVFGQYHVGEISSGEDQNALLGYSFKENRWDLVELTECAWSEHLPGVGHPYNKMAADDLHGLYVTRGNFTLNNDTMFRTYVYDLKAGRGKRMMPNEFWGLTSAAFDNDRDLMLTLAAGEACLYDHNQNVWTAAPGYPVKAAAQCVYDTKRKCFLLLGATTKDTPAMETWTFDAEKREWTKRPDAAGAPPIRTEFNVAYDTANGIVLLTGGRIKNVSTRETWVYDPAANAWTKLAADAPPGTHAGGGNNLTYDSDDAVFLLKHACDLASTFALKYVPANAPASGPRPADGVKSP